MTTYHHQPIVTSTTGSRHHAQNSYSNNYTTSYTTAAAPSSKRKVSEVVTSEKFKLPDKAYQQSERMVSSVVIFEEQDQIPDKPVRYVEVPQYEEVIKHVTVKEVREVEKVVPVVKEEWVERIVEVPQVEEVVRQVEVPQVQEVVKHVTKIEVVDRPYEVIKEVPRTNIIKEEKVVELGADMIEVPKEKVIEERVPITNYSDKDAMLIVSQKVRPMLTDGGMEVSVDVHEYEPEVLPVDIHVAKFVDQSLVLVGQKETTHRAVTVSSSQYNSMLRYLNGHLSPTEVNALPYLVDNSGQVNFLPKEYQWFAPNEGLKILGYSSNKIWGQGSVVSTAGRSTGITEHDIRQQQQQLDQQFKQIFFEFEKESQRRNQAIQDFNQRAIQNAQRELTTGTGIQGGPLLNGSTHYTQQSSQLIYGGSGSMSHGMTSSRKSFSKHSSNAGMLMS